jgi:hypothetical protein
MTSFLSEADRGAIERPGVRVRMGKEERRVRERRVGRSKGGEISDG